MDKKNKFIIIFYIILGFSFISAILYVDSIFRDEYPETMNSPSLPGLHPLEKIHYKTTVPIEREIIFHSLTNPLIYPSVLPNNFLSVEIIEQNENYIIATETIHERGIIMTFTVKHIIKPFDSHIIEILDGDAKGTILTQTFSTNGNNTNIVNDVTFELNGILFPLSFLPENNARHALKTVIDSFVLYESSKSDMEIYVDNLYREILSRPADSQGLIYYSNLLENNQITIDELREILLNSDEYKNSFYPTQLKPLDELNPDTKSTVDNLYREILSRPADSQGLIYYSNLLENNQITIDELREILLNSDEYKNSLKYLRDIQVNNTEN